MKKNKLFITLDKSEPINKASREIIKFREINGFLPDRILVTERDYLWLDEVLDDGIWKNKKRSYISLSGIPVSIRV